MATTANQIGTRTTWTFDPAHTLVEFSAKHMMFSTVKGRFADVKGTIEANLDNLADSFVEVEIDANSIDSRNEQRDTHLRSADFLEVENHPTITFKSTRIEPLSKDKLKVTGDLTIRGTTRPVTLDVTINGFGTSPWGTTVAGITAETQLSRKDWGLTWNVALEAGGVLVSDNVKFLVELEAIQQA